MPSKRDLLQYSELPHGPTCSLNGTDRVRSLKKSAVPNSGFTLRVFLRPPSGHRERQDDPQRQQQSLREVHRDRLRQPLPHHRGQHEDVSAGEVPRGVSGERELAVRRTGLTQLDRRRWTVGALCVFFVESRTKYAAVNSLPSRATDRGTKCK